MHETSGNHADSSGNGNTGTPAGTMTQDGIGKIDGADEFLNDTGVVTVSDNTGLDGMSALTLSGWLFPDDDHSGAGDWGEFIDKRGGGNSYELYFLGGTLTFRAHTTAGPNGNAGSVALTTGAWNHVVATYDGDIARVYVNGSEQVSSDLAADGTIVNTTGSVAIGNYATGANAWHGEIDETRISDVVRSSNWIWATYMTMASNSVFSSYGVSDIPEKGTVFRF